MSLFAISDLHLSLGSDKPMDVFGDLWENHHLKVMDNWNRKIGSGDTVLLAGDTSWALRLSEAEKDLNFINSLNGTKLIIKGNHDFWWSSITKLNAFSPSMHFIQNNFFPYGEYGVCGTRGWASIEAGEVGDHDEKIYSRELKRLELSLMSAQNEGFHKFIVMLHYPPKTRISNNREFLDILAQYRVEKLIYGHVHKDSMAICINGEVNGTEFICTSSDIINFDPIKVL